MTPTFGDNIGLEPSLTYARRAETIGIYPIAPDGRYVDAYRCGFEEGGPAAS